MNFNSVTWLETNGVILENGIGLVSSDQARKDLRREPRRLTRPVNLHTALPIHPRQPHMTPP